MKKGIKSIKNPSTKARLRIRRVVMERWRVRARMLQMIKRFPETPMGRKRQRIRAPEIDPALLRRLVILFIPELVVLVRKWIDMV